ncbi:MAG: hypothetical protein EOO41_00995, partial [Methanobacteriota archaeon]
MAASYVNGWTNGWEAAIEPCRVDVRIALPSAAHPHGGDGAHKLAHGSVGVAQHAPQPVRRIHVSALSPLQLSASNVCLAVLARFVHCLSHAHHQRSYFIGNASGMPLQYALIPALHGLVTASAYPTAWHKRQRKTGSGAYSPSSTALPEPTLLHTGAFTSLHGAREVMVAARSLTRAGVSADGGGVAGANAHGLRLRIHAQQDAESVLEEADEVQLEGQVTDAACVHLASRVVAAVETRATVDGCRYTLVRSTHALVNRLPHAVFVSALLVGDALLSSTGALWECVLPAGSAVFVPAPIASRADVTYRIVFPCATCGRLHSCAQAQDAQFVACAREAASLLVLAADFGFESTRGHRLAAPASHIRVWEERVASHGTPSQAGVMRGSDAPQQCVLMNLRFGSAARRLMAKSSMRGESSLASDGAPDLRARMLTIFFGSQSVPSSVVSHEHLVALSLHAPVSIRNALPSGMVVDMSPAGSLPGGGGALRAHVHHQSAWAAPHASLARSWQVRVRVPGMLGMSSPCFLALPAWLYSMRAAQQTQSAEPDALDARAARDAVAIGACAVGASRTEWATCFDAQGATLRLSVQQRVTRGGAVRVCISSPFLLVNRTSLSLLFSQVRNRAVGGVVGDPSGLLELVLPVAGQPSLPRFTSRSSGSGGGQGGRRGAGTLWSWMSHHVQRFDARFGSFMPTLFEHEEEGGHRADDDAWKHSAGRHAPRLRGGVSLTPAAAETFASDAALLLGCGPRDVPRAEAGGDVPQPQWPDLLPWQLQVQTVRTPPPSSEPLSVDVTVGVSMAAAKPVRWDVTATVEAALRAAAEAQQAAARAAVELAMSPAHEEAAARASHSDAEHLVLPMADRDTGCYDVGVRARVSSLAQVAFELHAWLSVFNASDEYLFIWVPAAGEELAPLHAPCAPA